VGGFNAYYVPRRTIGSRPGGRPGFVYGSGAITPKPADKAAKTVPRLLATKGVLSSLLRGGRYVLSA
jgi:hypothetical protein